MTVWTNEWAGASVLSVFVASAPGWLAVPLLRWTILEEKQAGGRGTVGSRVTATGHHSLFPNVPRFFFTPPCFSTRSFRNVLIEENGGGGGVCKGDCVRVCVCMCVWERMNACVCVLA